MGRRLSSTVTPKVRATSAPRHRVGHPDRRETLDCPLHGVGLQTGRTSESEAPKPRVIDNLFSFNRISATVNCQSALTCFLCVERFWKVNFRDKHDNHSSLPASAPLSATRATETNLQDFATSHVLRNGTSILIRAVRPDDEERVRLAFGELERTSIYTRFFGYKKALTAAELKQATNVGRCAVGHDRFRWGGNHYWGRTARSQRQIPWRRGGVHRRGGLSRTRNCELPLGSLGPYCAR